MATSEVTLSRLKAELTRTLLKHVGEAVNDVCDAFVDELRPVQTPLTPIPNVGALGKEVDYECCWRLVEYMEHNMDTSPSFVQQMDCIIRVTPLRRSSTRIENEIVDVMNASGCEIANSSDVTDIGDTYALNGVVAEVENAKHAAGGNKLFRKHGLTERIRAKESPVNVSKVDAGASVSTQTKKVSSPAKGAAIINFSSAVVPTKSSKTRSLPAQVYVELSSESISENDVMSSSSVQTSATESSRPHEWGKRKRLVTRKRGEGRRAPVKRVRQAPHHTHEQVIESDLRNVARDLEAGDMIWGLNVAKAMFQEMLDDLTISTSEGSQILLKILSGHFVTQQTGRQIKQSHSKLVSMTRSRSLTQRSANHLGTTHARETASQSARRCAMSSRHVSTQCAVYGTMQRAHLEECTNEQCEFRIRVKLRETMHLIEHKQQEIDSTRDALRSVNTLLSPNSKERTNVDSSGAFKLMESLERELITFNHEQMELIDIKMQQ
ncbi:hypothetical protein P3T76_004564 [Phytophthora citrophthora]|uniref:Uncharacterized protein n=1 Tax=Phytophthora citrophthora TaxID=4793 RepID=A0AAD9GU30_9STRA|nr:hypothetical protein P3T76_004564 [Phytophthora citrophthora]